MRTIYRFEDEYGTGMYAYNTASVKMQTNKNHPAPESDKKLRAKLGYEGLFGEERFYAFADLEQLHAWVKYKGWLKSMHKEGLFITEYKCKNADVFDGEKQVIFKRYKSKKQFSIPEYFDLSVDKPQKKSRIKVVAQSKQYKTTIEGEFK